MTECMRFADLVRPILNSTNDKMLNDVVGFLADLSASSYTIIRGNNMADLYNWFTYRSF